MNHVFDQVADHLQTLFIAGDVEKEVVTEVLTTLACALTDEGWYVEAVDHSIEKYQDWPIITKALRIAQGT